MLQQVLDLDRHVIRDTRTFRREPLDDRHRVTRPVEEVGIAKRHVRRAGLDLLAHVRDHHVDGDDAELPAVDRHDRTMPAQMLAAARRLRVPDRPHFVCPTCRRA